MESESSVPGSQLAAMCRIVNHTCPVHTHTVSHAISLRTNVILSLHLRLSVSYLPLYIPYVFLISATCDTSPAQPT
jgi:hypothetical protein